MTSSCSHSLNYYNQRQAILHNSSIDKVDIHNFPQTLNQKINFIGFDQTSII